MVPLVAAGLVGAVLPMSASQAKVAEPFSGFSTVGVASPVRMEIYESVIPIPSTPQLEVEYGYTTVEADSSSSLGRASLLWPGDSIGEGAKTFAEGVGLPPEFVENGYPVQSNAKSPSGPESHADEPFPGMVMRSLATPTEAFGKTGFSPDNEVQDPDSGGGDGGGDGGGGGGGGGGDQCLPELPIPGMPPVCAPSQEAGQKGLTKKAQRRQAAVQAGPGLPPEVAAIVDVSGYTSTSSTSTLPDVISTVSRSAVTDVSLIGGLITVSDAYAKATVASDGAAGEAGGKAGYSGLAIAGNKFRIGPDGVEAQGEIHKIDGLPDDPAEALAQLGVTVLVPEPAYTVEGDAATSSVEALRIEIDTTMLRDQLDVIPFGDIVGGIPDEFGELKKVIQAATFLSPKFVIVLGDATSTVDTVQGLEFPTDIPDNDHSGTGGGTGAGGGATSGGASGGGGTVSSGVDTGGGAVTGGGATVDGDLGDVAPTAAGLPPLFSIPGALLFGGVALAAIAGSWFRRAGLLALGGTGSCSHGLDSGLPDLRKA